MTHLSEEDQRVEDDLRLLAEGLRHLERVADEQSRASEAAEGKAAQVVTLAVAGLGAAAALGAYVEEQSDGVGALWLLGILGGAALNAFALVLAAQAYVGLHREEAAVTDACPDPDWVVSQMQDERTHLLTYQLAVAQGLAGAIDRNEKRKSVSIVKRHRALRLLIAAAATYAVVSAVFVGLLGLNVPL